MKRPIVIIESPYSNGAQESNVEGAVEYAKDACLHSIHAGEAPLASHLLYTQFLNDNCAVARGIGIDCGLAYADLARTIAFYIDQGISRGMFNALCTFANDQLLSKKVVFRSLKGDLGSISSISEAYMGLIEFSKLPKENSFDNDEYLKMADILFSPFLKAVESSD